MELGKMMGLLIICAVIMLIVFWLLRKEIAKVSSGSKKVVRMSTFIAYVLYTLIFWLICLAVWVGISLMFG